MANHKFTPGPWVAGRIAAAYVSGPNNRSICSTGSLNDGTEKTHYENIANAKLIAQSPILLQRLQEATDAIESLPPESLGVASSDEGTNWYIRDELVSHCREVIEQATQ